MFRGARVAMPCVDDHGVDLYAMPSVRIQVKSAYLRYHHRVYPQGAYWFKLWQCPTIKAGAVHRRGARQFSDQCDFLVLMGIDQQRFWVVPAAMLDGVGGVTVGPDGFFKRGDFEEAKRLKAAGLTQQEIGDRLGISQVAVSYQLRGGRTKKPQHKTALVRDHENRWDLITGAVATLREANQAVTTTAVIDREAYLKL